MRAALFAIVLLAGCASTKPTIYDDAAVTSVRMWTVAFMYEPGRTEETSSESKGAEVRVVREGRSRRELKLRDDLAFMLKDQYKLDVSRAARPGAGAIRVLPVDFSFGGFSSVDVELIAPSGDTLGRIQVKNGDRNATFKSDESFTEYVAEAIAGAIRGKK